MSSSEPRTVPRSRLIAVGVAAALLIWSGWRIRHAWTHVRTDDASVDGDVAPITSRVQAFVAEVRVEENAKVRAGDTLVVLDDHLLRIRLTEVEGILAATRAAAGTRGRAGLAFAQLEASRAQVAVAVRAVTEASGAGADEARRVQRAAEANQVRAEAALLAADPRFAAADAAVEHARLQVASTRLVAPVAGVVAARAVQVGVLAQPGQQLMVVVPGTDLFVTARLAETEVVGVDVGDSVEVRIEAFPRRRFTGVVESLSPTTVGTVPMIPVRIRFVTRIDSTTPLRPGMSAKVEIAKR